MTPTPDAPEPSFSPAATELARRLDDRSATIAVVGLGYVGLPLARAMHRAGYRVLGFDVDIEKIRKLQRGESYLKHLGDELVVELPGANGSRPTADPKKLGNADA
jgi:UDP-N-acetyl-D-glucosamine dehydrogenase